MMPPRTVLLLFLLFLHSKAASIDSFAFPSSSSAKEPSSVFAFDAISDIIQRISDARKWKLEHIHITSLDYQNAKFTKTTVYELELQAGKRIFPAKFVDEIKGWQRLDSEAQGSEEKIGNSSWISEVLASVLEPFQLSGPINLTFENAEEREEQGDLKKVNVAIGSLVRIEGAQEVSLAYPIELPLPINRSSPISGLVASISLLGTGATYTSQGEDASMLSLRVMGPTLTASFTGLPPTSRGAEPEDSNLEILSWFKELDGHEFEQTTSKSSIWPFPFLNTSNAQLSMFEDIIKLYLGSNIYKKRRFTIVHAKVAALTFVIFELEIERELAEESFDPELWPEWRTRPTVARHKFEVLAKVQGAKLVPIVIRPLKQYKNVETFTWRGFVSNISYTRFPSFLDPSSPMTLDVD